MLHSFEQAAHARDWQVGRHGIAIEFRASGRRYRATYLPYVAGDRFLFDLFISIEIVFAVLLTNACRGARLGRRRDTA